MDVEEALATHIYGASYPNDQLAPNFFPSRHGWNFPGSDGLLDLLQSSLIRFTQCDPASSIIAAAFPSSPEVFWVITLIFLGYTISHWKPKQPKWIVTTERVTNNEIAGIEITKRVRTKVSGRYDYRRHLEHINIAG